MNETELFARLAEFTRLREWLEAQIQEEVEVLTLHPDEHVLRQAQGRAQAWRRMLDNMDSARRVAGR